MVAQYAVLSIAAGALSVVFSPLSWGAALLAAPFVASGVILLVAAAHSIFDDIGTVERAHELRKDRAC